MFCQRKQHGAITTDFDHHLSLPLVENLPVGSLPPVFSVLAAEADFMLVTFRTLFERSHFNYFVLVTLRLKSQAFSLKLMSNLGKVPKACVILF